MNQLISSELYYKQIAVEESIKRNTNEKLELAAQLTAKKHELEMLKLKHEQLSRISAEQSRIKIETELYALTNLKLNLMFLGLSKEEFIELLSNTCLSWKPDDYARYAKNGNPFNLYKSAFLEVVKLMEYFSYQLPTCIEKLDRCLPNMNHSVFNDIDQLTALKQKLQNLSFDDAVALKGDNEITEYLLSNNLTQVQTNIFRVFLFGILMDHKNFTLTDIKSDIVDALDQRLQLLIKSEKLKSLDSSKIQPDDLHNADPFESQSMSFQTKNQPDVKLNNFNEGDAIEEALYFDNTNNSNEEAAAVVIQKQYKKFKQQASERRFINERVKFQEADKIEKSQFDKNLEKHKAEIDSITCTLKTKKLNDSLKASDDEHSKYDQQNYEQSKENSQCSARRNQTDSQKRANDLNLNRSSDNEENYFEKADNNSKCFSESNQAQKAEQQVHHFYETGSVEPNYNAADNDFNQYDEETHKAATKIQSVYKGNKVRNQIKLSKNKESSNSQYDSDTYHKAAVKIQSKYRGAVERKKYNEMKRHKVVKPNNALLEDNKHNKDHLINRKSSELSKVKKSNVNNEEEAALVIQKHYKGLQQKKARHEHQNKNNQEALEREKAAIKIQSKYKGVKQQRAYKQHKEQVRPAKHPNVESQTKTNNHEQMAEDRKIEGLDQPLVLPNPLDYEEEYKAAVKIQSLYKGSKDRKKYKEIIQSKKQMALEPHFQEIKNIKQNQIDEDRAAIKIQSVVRGKNDRKKIKELKNKKNQKADKNLHEQNDGTGRAIQLDENFDIAKQNAAAIKIQKVYKGKKVRNHKKEKAERVTREEAVPLHSNADKNYHSLANQDDAAAKIQAAYRGKRVRAQIKEIKNNAPLQSKAEQDKYAQLEDKFEPGLSNNYILEKLDKIDLDEIKPKAEAKNSNPNNHYPERKLQASSKIITGHENWDAKGLDDNINTQNPKIATNDEDRQVVNLKKNYKGFLSKKKLEKYDHPSEVMNSSTSSAKSSNKNKEPKRLSRNNNSNKMSQPIYDARLEIKTNQPLTHRKSKNHLFESEKRNKKNIKTTHEFSKTKRASTHKSFDSKMDESFSIPDGKVHFYEKADIPKLNDATVNKEPRLIIKDKLNLNNITSNTEIRPLQNSFRSNIPNSLHPETKSIVKNSVTDKKSANIPIKTETEIHAAVNSELGKILEEVNDQENKKVPQKRVQIFDEAKESAQQKSPFIKDDKIDYQTNYIILSESRNFLEEISKKSAVQVYKTGLSASKVQPSSNNINADPFQKLPKFDCSQVYNNTIQRLSKKEVKSILSKVFNKFVAAENDKMQKQASLLDDQKLPESLENDFLIKKDNTNLANISIHPDRESQIDMSSKYTSLAKNIDKRIVGSNKLSNSKFDEKHVGFTEAPINFQTETDYELKTNESRSSINHGGGELFVAIKQVSPPNLSLEGNMLKISLENDEYKILSLASEQFPKFKFTIEKQKFVLFEIIKQGNSTYSKTFPLEGLLFTERSVVTEAFEFFINQESVFIDFEFEWIANQDSNPLITEYEPPNFTLEIN